MRTTEQFMADMQPIIDRLAGRPMNEDEVRARIEQMTGQSFRTEFHNVFYTRKADDQLPPGCDGCRVDLAGNLICCVNQGEEE